MTTATNCLVTCPNCGESVDCEKLIEVSDSGTRCDCCIAISEDCFMCDACERYALDVESIDIQTPTGVEYICKDCVRRVATQCHECGDYIYFRHSEITANGNSICLVCFRESYITCETCSAVVHVDDAAYPNEQLCANCQPYEANFRPTGFCDCYGLTSEIGSARCFGVELETDECDGYAALADTKAWGAKNDPSVSGKEFYSDILSGDEGLNAIREWGKLADQKNWYASDQAGYHLHLDMRDESDDSLFAIAYAYRKTQEVWQSFVCDSRHDNSYSYAIQWSCYDVNYARQTGRGFSDFATRRDRYQWCNLTAYGEYNTFEIRLHEGTCDTLEIINWIKAHTRFADWASKLGYEGVKEALDSLSGDDMFTLIIQEVWKSPNLSAYYSGKARHHGHGFLTRKRA